MTGRRENAGILVWVMILAGASVGQCQEDAQSLFDSVYNTRIQAVRATGNREDDVALAREMLDAARSAQGSAARPLAALLCEQAYELAKRTPEGLDTAVGAMKLLASDDSPERVQARCCASASTVWLAGRSGRRRGRS